MNSFTARLVLTKKDKRQLRNGPSAILCNITVLSHCIHRGPQQGQKLSQIKTALIRRMTTNKTSGSIDNLTPDFSRNLGSLQISENQSGFSSSTWLTKVSIYCTHIVFNNPASPFTCRDVASRLLLLTSCCSLSIDLVTSSFTPYCWFIFSFIAVFSSPFIW